MMVGLFIWFFFGGILSFGRTNEKRHGKLENLGTWERDAELLQLLPAGKKEGAFKRQRMIP